MAGRDLFDLIAERKVEVEVTGSGIQSVSLRLRRRVPHELPVRIPIGTFFASHNPSAQNMVGTEEATVTLHDDHWVDVSVDAACANRPLDIPGGEDRFTVQRSPQQTDLRKLMPVLDQANADSETRQAAVWIVTDDATYDDLGILVSRPAYAMFGGSRVINEAEAARAMQLCDKAGINIKSKAIWQERAAILKQLTDEGLKRWLRERARR